MQVFNTFFKITKKQIPSFITYFVIFTILLCVMSAIGTGNNAYTESRLSVAIFNQDTSTKAEYLTEYLSEKHDIVTVENDDETIRDSLFFEVLDYVLYIEDGCSLTNIKRPGSTTGMYVDNQIDAFCKTYDAYISAGCDEAEANEKTIQALDNENLVSMKGKGSKKPTIYYFYTYLTYILIGLLINAMAPVIIALNRKEVKERSEISPLTVKSRNLQIFGGSVLFSLGVWFAMIAVSVVMFRGELFRNQNAFIILNSFCFLILSAGVVSIISGFSMKPQIISMVSNVVSLSFSFLGGVFVPMEIFSDTVLTISKFTPSYWYVIASEKIFAGKVDNSVFMCMGIQLLFALAFFAVALVISKRRKLSRAS